MENIQVKDMLPYALYLTSEYAWKGDSVSPMEHKGSAILFNHVA